MTRRLLTQLRSLSTSPLLGLDPPQTNLFQCNKRIQELVQLGQIEEAQKLFDEMSQRDSVTWNLLIDGYCRSGKIDRARALFDVFEGKNVRTWTTLLSGYAKNGRISEARSVFESMPVRNVVSWNAMISGYVQFGDLVSARWLFDQMGLRNIATWNSMITGYCRCHRMYEAKELFDQMWERNLVSWMVMISGYVECSYYREAWGLFVSMCRSDVRPDQAIFLAAVLAVTGLNDLVLIKCLHGVGSKMGFVGDVIVGTAILNAYTNVCLMSALNFFETMPERNDYSWTTMIAAYAHHGRLDEAVAIFERVPEQTVSTRTAILTAFAQNGRVQEARFQFDKIQNPNLVTWNAMLAGYAQNGMVEEAKDIFFKMPDRNSASWAAMIAGLVQNGWDMEALELLAELHRSGAIPNHSSFTSALFACANISAVEMGRQIHSLTIKTGCHVNTYVGNGLISMYGKAENKEDDSQDFSTMRMRETEDWDYISAGLLKDSVLVDAHIIFDRMPKRDVVSWTSIISTYAQAGHGEIAFELFLDMMIGGMKPNQLTMTSLLSACGSLGEKGLGGQVHALIFKSGFDSCLFVCNALIAMYFKCGCEDGFMVFREMAQKDIVTWNAMLAGCVQNEPQYYLPGEPFADYVFSKLMLFCVLMSPNFSNIRRNTIRRSVIIFADNKNNGNGSGNGNGGDDELKGSKRNGRPGFVVKLKELILDPDPENLVAVGLTGLLTWASVQVLWQLLFISGAILVAAIKYSFIAAFLLFILITLL
ncbi:Pentatricopeptide repeat [Dillenia turbinata]|uniref:Pentatricopeptide repeat n=1 Tax=Dillenia turbinata TaxID=194707 RepID=A0AAN8Z8V6_9MAGN